MFAIRAKQLMPEIVYRPFRCPYRERREGFFSRKQRQIKNKCGGDSQVLSSPPTPCVWTEYKGGARSGT